MVTAKLGKPFIDNDSTCAYQISVTYNTTGNYTQTTPCSTTTPVENGVFSIVSDSLTFNEYTVKIISITKTQFETLYLSTIDGTDPIKQVEVIQRFKTE